MATKWSAVSNNALCDVKFDIIRSSTADIQGLPTENHGTRDRDRDSIDEGGISTKTDIEVTFVSNGDQPVKAESSLERLPAELLQRIVWLSYNPAIPLASSTLMSRLSSPNNLRREMIVHVFNGWPAAHNRLELLQLFAPSSRYAEVLSADSRLQLQKLIFAQSWCTLKAFKSAAACVMRAWIKAYWSLEDRSPAWRLEDGILDDLLNNPRPEPFRTKLGFVGVARDFVLSINHAYINVQPADQFYGYEDPDENSGSNSSRYASNSFEGAHLIATPAKVNRLLIPPVMRRADNPTIYDSWASRFCEWYKVLKICQIHSDKYAEAWDPGLLMYCLGIALENQTASVFKYCLDAYCEALPEADFHSFDTLHDGFILRLKDRCVKLGRWGYVSEIVQKLHTDCTMPRKWFTDEEVQEILFAGHYDSRDVEVIELARHFRTHAGRPTCEACVGRRLQNSA